MISELSIPHWILITGFGVFTFTAFYFIIEIVRKTNIDDLSQAKGPTIPAVIYSLTGAMSPFKKETAHLLKSETMKRRLLEAKERQQGISLEEAREKLGI